MSHSDKDKALPTKRKSVKQNWKDFINKHGDKIPASWKDGSNRITIETGEEPFNLLQEGLKARSIVHDKFLIDFALLKKPHVLAEICKIFKLLEEYNRYYALQLNMTEVIENNEQTRTFFKLLTSKNCRINSLATNVALSAESALIFNKLLEQNTITDLDLTIPTPASTGGIIAHCIEGLKGLANNRTIQTLQLFGLGDDREISKILEKNHSITDLALGSHGLHNFSTEEHLVPALAKMGSLQSIFCFFGLRQPKNYGSLCAVLKGNKYLEKLVFTEMSYEPTLSSSDCTALAAAIMAHPSLQKLILPGISMCPLIKAISGSKTITTLDKVPIEQIITDEELQKSILSMKSLRKLTIVRENHYETEAEKKSHQFDLSNLVHPSSSIRILVFDRLIDYEPTAKFIEALGNRTSVEQIRIKEQFRYWPEICQASTTNPFLIVQCNPVWDHRYDQIKSITTKRRSMMMEFRRAISCLNILRIIHLSTDRGFFATIPNEILILILQKLSMDRDLARIDRSLLTLQENQIQKLQQIAIERSVLKERNTIKRLQSLWIDYGIKEICTHEK